MNLYGFGFESRENIRNIGGSAHVRAFGDSDRRRNRRCRCVAVAVASCGIQVRPVGWHGRWGRSVVSSTERRSWVRVGVTHTGWDGWGRRALIWNVWRCLSWRLRRRRSLTLRTRTHQVSHEVSKPRTVLRHGVYRRCSELLHELRVLTHDVVHARHR